MYEYLGSNGVWKMARKVADCRQFPSEKNCSLTIAGTEDDLHKIEKN